MKTVHAKLGLYAEPRLAVGVHANRVSRIHSQFKFKKMALNSDCSLKDQDWEFVKKLTRVAHVNVLSKQVSLIFKSSNFDLGTNANNKLQFPENWSLQYVGIYPSKYEDRHAVTMTFEVFP